MERSLTRIPSLDGLRTLSIALVIVGHFFHVVGLGDFGNLGNLGVRVFFVISGFLITGLLLKEIDRTSSIDLLKFYFRRTLRIFPPYYFFLLVLILSSAIGLISISGNSLFFASVYVTDYINPSNWFLGHTWSLAVEEQFYLLFPAALLLCGVRRTKIFLLILVVILPFVRLIDFHFSEPESVWILKGFHANSDALAIGCLLSLFNNRIHANAYYQRFLRSGLVLLLPFIILICNFQYSHPNIFFGLSISIMNISIALFLDWSVTNRDSVLGRFLNTRIMVVLGGMSYSIYLWQQIFFNPESHSPITWFPFNFLGLAIVSSFSYLFVEKYFLRLRQKWERKLFGTFNASSERQLEFVPVPD